MNRAIEQGVNGKMTTIERLIKVVSIYATMIVETHSLK